MPRTRWGAEAPEDASAAKGRLVDAAAACFERYGVTKTSVEDIATEAHVSRATVYRYFEGGRDELVLCVGLREVRRFAGEVQRRTARQRTVADGIVEGIMLTVRAVQERPTLALLFTQDTAGYTEALVGGSDALRAETVGFLEPLLDEAKRQGAIRADVDVGDAAEWFVRVVMSLATMPSRRRPADQRRWLREYFVPAFLPADSTGRETSRRRDGDR
jgi:AcrR family transcriptional regulator